MIQGLSAIEPVSGALTGAQAGAQATAAPAAPAPELASRFEALLDQARQSRHHSLQPSAIGELVAKEDAAIHASMERIEQMTHTPALSPQQVLAQGVQMQMECAATMTRIHLGSMIAHSGKSAVQTLMRNQ